MSSERMSSERMRLPLLLNASMQIFPITLLLVVIIKDFDQILIIIRVTIVLKIKWQFCSSFSNWIYLWWIHLKQFTYDCLKKKSKFLHSLSPTKIVQLPAHNDDFVEYNNNFEMGDDSFFSNDLLIDNKYISFQRRI